MERSWAEGHFPRSNKSEKHFFLTVEFPCIVNLRGQKKKSTQRAPVSQDS